MLEESLEFIASDISFDKLIEIRDKILETADTLLLQPFSGQREYLLEHLGLGHRRLVEGHYKIIYRVVDNIFILQIFISLQI